MFKSLQKQCGVTTIMGGGDSWQNNFIKTIDVVYDKLGKFMTIFGKISINKDLISN